MTSIPNDPLKSNDRSKFRRGYVVFVLCLVMIINMIDRQILSILVEPIKSDLHISDTQVGLLTGLAFALFYVTAGFPLARWADRGIRRNIIAYCVGFWSFATVLCGLGANFWQLAAARMGVAAGEAGAGSITQSLLGDLFSLAERGRAVGIVSASAAFGLAFGMFVGGWLNDLVGWRMVFVIVGLPGVLVALLVRFTISEPIRRNSRGVASTSTTTFWETATFCWRQKSFRFIVLGLAVNAFTGYGTLAWLPAFFIRVHGLSIVQVGLWMGLSTAIGLVAGSLSAGWLSDRFGKLDPRSYLWVSAAGSAIALPLILAALFIPLAGYALVMFCSFKIAMGLVQPSVNAIAQDLVQPNMRATAGAIILCVQNIIGLALGPLLIGMTADAMAPRFGLESIRYALAAATLTLALAAFLSFYGARWVRQDLATVAGENAPTNDPRFGSSV